MRVHFISIHIEPAARAVPLGAAMIAQSLSDHFPDTVSISIIDCYLKDSPEERVSATVADNPDVVCFSVFLWNAEAALAMIREIKKIHPAITVIVGGALPTALPDYYASITEIDYVLPGEAEYTLPATIRGLAAGRKQPTIIPQGSPPSVSALPSPYLSGLIDPAEYHGALWELSRGCPYRCAFCFESRGTSGIRRFPESRLKAELDLFLKSGIPEILVLDPTFNYDKAIAKRNLRMILDAETDIHFTFEIRAEHIDQELAELFANIHCTLQIGLQSIHSKVLEKIQRNCNIELFREKVYLLHEQHVPYGLDLIYGLPGDSLAGFLESIDYAFSLVPNHVDIFPLAVIPGTVLYDKAEYHGLDFHPENGYLVERTPAFSKDDMHIARRIARFAEYFYNLGKAVSWFDLILSNLHISSSRFFQLGVECTDESDYLLSPLEFQLTILERIWDIMNPDFSFSLLRDLVVYFWHYNGVFSESAESPLQHSGILFNPSIRLDSFSFHPQEMTDAIAQGIDDFTALQQMLTKQELLLAFACTDDQLSCLECTPYEYGYLKDLLENPRKNEQTMDSLSDESKKRLIYSGMAAPLHN